MSEESKKSRSLPEVRQEYANVCAKAGSHQYQIRVLEKELEAINSTLQALNFEAASIQEAAKAAASEAAKAVASEPAMKEGE